MTRMTDEQRAALKRAADRARAVLKPGDRIRVTRCAGTFQNFVFAGWDGDAIVSKSGWNDISPRSVIRLNGEPVRFSDPLTPESHFGPDIAPAYLAVVDALQRFAHASYAKPGDDTFKHFLWHNRHWDETKLADAQAKRFPAP